MSVARGIPFWCWWIVVVWFVSLPWIGFTRAPQWDRVHATPFTDPEDKPRDLFMNVAMFVPFGYSYARWRQGRRAWLEALAIAGAVSTVAEATQLFSTLRNPSGTDVVAAAAGTLIGLAVRRPG